VRRRASKPDGHRSSGASPPRSDPLVRRPRAHRATARPECRVDPGRHAASGNAGTEREQSPLLACR
jgi:hypothetical protein